MNKNTEYKPLVRITYLTTERDAIQLKTICLVTKDSLSKFHRRAVKNEINRLKEQYQLKKINLEESGTFPEIS